MDIENKKKLHSGTFNIYNYCLANQDGSKFIFGNGNILIYITTDFNKYVILNYPETDDVNMNMYSHINISDTHVIIAMLKPTLRIYTFAIADINSMITQSDPKDPLLDCTKIITWQNINLPDYVQQYLTTNTDDLNTDDLIVGIIKGIGNTFLCVINNYILLLNPITNTFWDISYNQSKAITNMTIDRTIEHIIIQIKDNKYIVKPTTMDIDFECKPINIDIKQFTFLSKYNFIAGIKDNKCYIAFLETIINNPNLDFNSKWYQTIIPFEDPTREFIIDIQIYNRILVVQTYKNIYAAVAITPNGIPINPSKLIWQKITVKPITLKLYQTAVKFDINIIKDDHLEEYDTNLPILWCSLLTPVQKKNSEVADNIFAVTMNGNIYQILYNENYTFEAEHIFMSEMKPIQDRHLDHIVSQYIFLDKYVITVPNNDEILSPQEILSKKIIDNAIDALADELSEQLKQNNDTIVDDKPIDDDESVSQE